MPYVYSHCHHRHRTSIPHNHDRAHCMSSVMFPSSIIAWRMMYSLLLVALFAVYPLMASASPSPVPWTQCRVVTTIASNHAYCNSNEIILGGGGSCDSSPLSTSFPLSSLQGWSAYCADGRVPVSITVHCCQAAADTFSSPMVTSSNRLAPWSFARQCSWINQVEANVDGGISSVSVTCPENQTLALTGGGSCSTGWALSSSWATGNGTGWSVECSQNDPATSASLSVVQSVGVCCQPLSLQASCTRVVLSTTSDASSNLTISGPDSTMTTGGLNNVTVPQSLAYCTQPSQLALGIGSECPDYSQLQQQTIFSPFEIPSATLHSCFSNDTGNVGLVPPARISYQCCEVFSAGGFAPTSTNYCPDVSSLVRRDLGSVTSSHPNSPSALGAIYSLTCTVSNSSLHLAGAASIQCLSNGTWSSGGQLGQCLALDVQGCVTVQSISYNDNSETVSSLSCPTTSDWVLVSASGLCQSPTGPINSVSILLDEPTSLSTWESRCYNAATNLTQPAHIVTGICCPKRPNTLFSSCRFVSAANRCGSDEDALTVGHNQGAASNSICCTKLSPSSCNAAYYNLSAPINSASPVSIARATCDIGQVLWRQSPINRTSLGAITALHANRNLQWSHSVVLPTNHQLSNESLSPNSLCCKSQALCSWQLPLPMFSDPSRTALFWTDLTSTTYFCQPGYVTSVNSLNAVAVECRAASASSAINAPSCFPTICSNLTLALGPYITMGPIFDQTGTSTRLTCSDGLQFDGYDQSELFVQCTGSLDSGEQDWQPTPSALRCVEAVKNLTQSSSRRRLLQVVNNILPNAATVFFSAFADPYTLTLNYNMNGSNMMITYNSSTTGSQVSSVTQLVWAVGVTQLWPLNGVGVEGASIPAMGGLSLYQDVLSAYNQEQWTFTLDSYNYIEGVQVAVAFSLRQWNWNPTPIGSLAGQPFVMRTNNSNNYCLRAVDSYTTLTTACDMLDQTSLWTYSNGLIQNVLNGLCLAYDLHYIITVDCAQPRDMVTIAQWSSATSTFVFVSPNGSPNTWPFIAVYTRYVIPPIAEWQSGFSNQQTLFQAFVFNDSTSFSEVLVGTYNVNSTCSCNLSDPNGAPTNLTLYQRAGMDRVLRLSFVPQSLCNDEFFLVETTNGTNEQVDMPVMQAHSFDNYASCVATTLSFPVLDLTWNQTCYNRTFCMIPLPREICPTCIDQYIPGQTSPNITTCVTAPAQFWFTVTGLIETAGGLEGITAPVGQVFVAIQVIDVDSTVLYPTWSALPIGTASATTDNSGRFSITVSQAFAGGPQQFYQVLALPSKSTTYNDLQPTIFFSGTQSNWQLGQLGLNEHITIDFNLTEQTVNQTQTQLLLHAEWNCLEPTGNVSHISAFVCNVSSANAILITVQVRSVTLSTTTVYFSNGQAMSRDNTTTTNLDIYEWSVPWNINLTLNANATSATDWLIGQNAFDLIEPNLYNDSQPLSTTPYVLDANFNWLSPYMLVTNLANNTIRSVAYLVVPPTLDELEQQCAPICSEDDDDVATLVIASGLAPPVYGPSILLPPITDQIVNAQLLTSSSMPVAASNLWFNVTLRSGSSFTFLASDISSVALAISSPPLGVNALIWETNATMPIVIVLSQASLVQSYQTITSSALRVWPSLSAVLTIVNCSAVLQNSAIAPYTQNGLQGISYVLTSRIPDPGSPVTFRLMSAANPNQCMTTSTTNCNNGVATQLGLCSSAVTWQLSANLGLLNYQCSQEGLDMYGAQATDSSYLEHWNFGGGTNQQWIFGANSQIASRVVGVAPPIPPQSAGASLILPVSAVPLSLDQISFYDFVTQQQLVASPSVVADQVPYSPRSDGAVTTFSISWPNPTTPSFTWSLWFYLTSTASITDSTPSTLVSTTSNGLASSWVIGLSPTSLYFKLGQYTSYCASKVDNYDGAIFKVSTWSIHQWYHVAGSYDHVNQMAYLYLNGSLVNQTAVRSTFISSDRIQLGYLSCFSNRLPGGIQTIGVYDQPLGESHIRDLYEMQLQPSGGSRLTDYIPSPTLPIPVTETANRCVSTDPVVSSTFVGQRACAAPSGVIDFKQQWVRALYLNSLAPISATRTFYHQFEAMGSYDGSPIGSTTVEFAQTMYFPMMWSDQSTVTVAGVITIAQNLLLPGVEHCGMSNIVVEAFAVDDLNFENPIATSTLTDGSGRWALALPVHQVVVVRPYYNALEQEIAHTFSPSWLTLPVNESNVNNLQFIDTTSNTFTVSLVGGLCNIPIAKVSPVFELESCNNRRWIMTSQTFSSLATTYILPATNLTFIAYSGRSEEPTITAMSNLLPTELAAVKSYLLINGKFDLDLSSQNITSMLRYHAPASVELVGPWWAQTPQCMSNGYNFSILQEGTVVRLQFDVSEQYGNLPPCAQIDPDLTSIWIRDLVSAEPALPCYNPGCTVNVTTTGRALYTTRVGSPYFYSRTNGAKYTRDILFGIAGTAQRDANRISVLATGSYVYDGVDSIKLAPSSMVPAFILRRPPGGTSAAAFSGSFGMSTDVSMDIGTSLSGSLGYDIGFSGTFELKAMTAPLGFGTDQSLGSLSFEMDSSGFVPVLGKLPDEKKMRRRMIVPEFNDDVFGSVLAKPKDGLYDPSDVFAPFKPSQDCSVFSVIRGFAESALGNIEGVAEAVVSPIADGRRRLLAGEFDCEASTDKSLSLGKSSSYTVSVETTEDPAVINGDGDMFLMVVHDVLISYTNVLIAYASNSASQPANTSYDSWQNRAKYIGANSPQCIVIDPEQVLTASSSSDSQLLWVSQWTIVNQIIPFSNFTANKYHNDPSATDQTLAYANSLYQNIINWQGILNLNNQLKQQAKPWPELLQYLAFNRTTSTATGQEYQDYSSPFYLDGDDVVVSFSGDMGAIGFEIDTGVEQSISNDNSFDTSGSSSASLGGSVKVGGFGLSANIDWSYSNAESIGTGSSSDNGNERSISFELSDPDRGDTFDVVIRRDPVYGTPVFITRAGRSRCRQEAGTVVRESLALDWVSIDTNARTAQLQVANTGLDTENEAFSYYLNVVTETNSKSWSITVNGVPMMQNSVRFTVPTVTTQEKTGPIVLSFVFSGTQTASPPDSGLRFRLTGVCYEDIVSPGQYAYETEFKGPF